MTALPAAADDLDSAVASARGGSLPTSSEAESLANASASAQAAAEKPFHADISSLLAVCDSVGEVVGFGPNIARIFEAFAGSSGHWSVITSSAWTSMGTGQVRGADGYLYVSVVFCEGGTTAAPATTTTTPPPPPAPAQAAAPTSSASPATTSVSAQPDSEREICPLAIGETVDHDHAAGFCII